MTPQELDRLWDPKAPRDGAEAIVELERALASARGPRPAPPLALPPRAPARSEDTGRVWGMAAAILLVAASLIAYFALRSSGDGTAQPLMARAPEQGQPGWRVEAFEGEEMCQAPGVEQAVQEGSLLPDDTALDTGPGSTAHLRNGTAAIDLHPNSQLRRVGPVLELANGRLWAELPPRTDGRAWDLRTDGVELQTQGARFVWWAYESPADELGSPFRLGEEVGIEVVGGEVRFDAAGRSKTARAGERCVLSTAGAAVRCEPVAPGN